MRSPFIPGKPATYGGPIVEGYWRSPGPVKWKPVSIEPPDTRFIVGPSAQVWYGATWVHTPQQVEIDLAAQGHPMTPVRWFLNDERVVLSEKETREFPRQLRENIRTVTLTPGWNRIHFRAYNYGYTPFRQGLVLRGDAAKLWPLRLSNQPPTQ